jgi:hypothetical protein
VSRTLGAVVLVSITAIAATAVGYQISNYSSEWIGVPVATILLVSGARGAWAVRKPTYRSYVVDTRGLSAGDRSGVCNLVIRTLEETAAEFEADIPWSQAAAWPPGVRDAAEVLITASGRTHTGELYQQTGMMKRSDHASWQAFAIFSGYANDASVWSNSRLLPIVSLADEGTSVWSASTKRNVAASKPPSNPRRSSSSASHGQSGAGRERSAGRHSDSRR